MVLAAGKLVLNVDTQAGNQSASEYAQPTLWGWLDARDRKLWPTFLRGDIAHANEKMMAGAEERQLPYLIGRCLIGQLIDLDAIVAGLNLA